MIRKLCIREAAAQKLVTIFGAEKCANKLYPHANYCTIYEGLEAKVTSLKLRLEMICSNCHA